MISSTLTTVVALWGALLSTFVVLRDLWRGRRRARVSVEYGALALPAGQQPFVLTSRAPPFVLGRSASPIPRSHRRRHSPWS